MEHFRYKHLLWSVSTVLLFFLTRCNTDDRNQKEQNNKFADTHLEAPSEKEVLLLVMQNCDVKLTVNSSCKGVTTKHTDSTIGQYLSGFWQYHADTTSKNYIEITVERGNDERIKEVHWKATLMLNGIAQDDPWSWGVSFIILKKNHEVIKDSFRCIGAG